MTKYLSKLLPDGDKVAFVKPPDYASWCIVVDLCEHSGAAIGTRQLMLLRHSHDLAWAAARVHHRPYPHPGQRLVLMWFRWRWNQISPIGKLSRGVDVEIICSVHRIPGTTSHSVRSRRRMSLNTPSHLTTSAIGVPSARASPDLRPLPPCGAGFCSNASSETPRTYLGRKGLFWW